MVTKDKMQYNAKQNKHHCQTNAAPSNEQKTTEVHNRDDDDDDQSQIIANPNAQLRSLLASTSNASESETVNMRMSMKAKHRQKSIGSMDINRFRNSHNGKYLRPGPLASVGHEGSQADSLCKGFLTSYMRGRKQTLYAAVIDNVNKYAFNMV